jgi:hypothetical protein
MDMNCFSRYKTVLFAILTGWALSACTGNFDDINTDPNATSKASSALLATSVTGNLVKWDIWISVANDGMRSKIICDTEGAQAAQYNLLGRGTFEGYNLLITAEKMVDNATSPALADAYRGLALFTKAYKMYYTTMQMGDIPYSEALLGEKEGIIQPKYDPQKDVFRLILDDLDAANTYFANATVAFGGDVLFDGDPKKWQRVTNSFALKVLIALSKRADDTPDLNVKARFAEVAARPLLESNGDNLRYECRNQPGMYPPYYRVTNQSWMYLRMSSVMTDILKKHDDYRLFYYAEPSEYYEAQGISVSDTACYPGINPSWNNTDIETLTGERKTCRINARYLDDPDGEPIARVGFAQQEFILAEGALRGWLPGHTASQHYLKAIEAGLRFTADNTKDDPLFHHNRKITDSYITQQLGRASLQLSENPAAFEADLQKIIEQKFAASFIQYKYDPFYDNRRTGWPVYPIDPSTNQNELVDRMPIRWMYPMEEATQNTESYQEAIDRQFGGIDDHNVHIWLTR